MMILGIETSCDETAAAVVEDGSRVRSSVVWSQHTLHAAFAGVVPELASRAHATAILPVVRDALTSAGIAPGGVDAVAVGHRPGLIGSLLVGVAAAKTLAWSLGVPLIAVDHVHAHLYAASLAERDGPGPEVHFPALGLVVSGGHTSIYELASWLEPRRLGATIDDALGEAFDKAATVLGLPYPGGPNLDRLASTPGADDRAADLPISRIAPGSLDFSFSGLKTALLYEARGVPDPSGRRARRGDDTPPPPMTERRRADLAASFQRAACAAVTLKLGRAFDHLRGEGRPPRCLIAGGGVTANSALRRALADLARDRGVPLLIPPMSFCVDNAAMIAGLACPLLRTGRLADLTLQPVPTTAC
ncbi:MAG: tRNA (adenosine(37)-N6)-threonylcarbamoyltransferase complex transferase subunit TsaD [Phycisphaeraceae bacterium]|nr:MAG: tRNA (adenosine(37)-N6)-threonylcarbamoyltransferase complex transferase subunit TsaD [Phycisphaeraceae bacterium]